MKTKKLLVTFEELSDKFRTYILKYYSLKFENPIYIVWYTDTKGEADRLLTYKSSSIFATDDISNIQNLILSIRDNLISFDNLDKWLSKGLILDPIEYSIFDIRNFENDLSNSSFTEEFLKDFANFINLADDYFKQIGNSELQNLIKSEIIQKTWNFYYDDCFWTDFAKKNNKKLELNNLSLLKEYQRLRDKFESFIELPEKHSH